MLKKLAIAGDILIILFVSYNAIDEGFKGSRLQIVVIPALVLLLILNIYLISKHAK
jgi:hypothetical protein